MFQNKEERHHRKDWDTECGQSGCVKKKGNTEFHTKTP